MFFCHFENGFYFFLNSHTAFYLEISLGNPKPKQASSNRYGARADTMSFGPSSFKDILLEYCLFDLLSSNCLALRLILSKILGATANGLFPT